MPIDLPCIDSLVYVPLYVLGFAYMFLSCHVLTEDFFVPSLEKLAIRWHLSKDVAGATLMALGSSGPEIAVNVIDTVFGEEDLGILSVVGSALFNICFITAMSILFAPLPLEISWKPFIRDFVFYFFSILSLTLACNDYKIEVLEAFGLISLYVAYVTFLMYQHRIFDWIDDRGGSRLNTMSGAEYVILEDNNDVPLPIRGIRISDYEDNTIRMTDAANSAQAPANDEVEYTVTYKKMPLGFDLHPCPNELNAVVGKLTSDFARDNVHQGSMVVSVNDLWLLNQSFEFACERLFSECASQPVQVTFRRKIPKVPLAETNGRGSFLENPYHARESVFVRMGDENFEKFRGSEDFDTSELIEVDPHHQVDASDSGEFQHRTHCGRIVHCVTFPIEFLMRNTIPKSLYLSFVGCIFWILIISYTLTQLTKLTGCALHIDLVLMGMIFLAAGTSIPDMLCSIAVSKQMEGDMCISNISGSNISNVLLGIGLPWFIETLVTGKPHEPEVAKLNYYLGFLVASHFFSIFLFMVSRFTLRNWMAITLLVLYACFIAYVIYIDLYFHVDAQEHGEHHSKNN